MISVKTEGSGGESTGEPCGRWALSRQRAERGRVTFCGICDLQKAQAVDGITMLLRSRASSTCREPLERQYSLRLWSPALDIPAPGHFVAIGIAAGALPLRGETSADGAEETWPAGTADHGSAAEARRVLGTGRDRRACPCTHRRRETGNFAIPWECCRAQRTGEIRRLKDKFRIQRRIVEKPLHANLERRVHAPETAQLLPDTRAGGDLEQYRLQPLIERPDRFGNQLLRL